jgi:hypothetical protein
MKNLVPATQVLRAIKGTVFTSAFHSHATVGDRYETNPPHFADHKTLRVANVLEISGYSRARE